MIEYASLVVLSLERPAVLEWSLESLMAHTKYPHELIVHDDGSTSRRVEGYLSGLLRGGRLSSLVLNPMGRNMGIGFALARTLPMCSGKYIAILGGDYQYRDGWLQEAVRILEAFPEVSLVSLARASDMAFDKDTHERFEEREGLTVELKWSPGTGAVAFRRIDLEVVWPIDFLATARAEQWTVIKALCPIATRQAVRPPYPETLWCAMPMETKVAHPPVDKLQGIFGAYDYEGHRHRRPAHRFPLLHGDVDLAEEEALWCDEGVPLRELGTSRGNRYYLYCAASIGARVMPPPLYGVPDWSF